jgi:hypothetical protein
MDDRPLAQHCIPEESIPVRQNTVFGAFFSQSVKVHCAESVLSSAVKNI